MLGIDTKVVRYCLAIHPSPKPVVQRKQKVGEENKFVIDVEAKKLSNAGFITETKYPTWLDIIVLVRKANNKWNMCVEFTDLNASCHNDPYLLLDMHRLIDKSLGCHMLIFMEAYSKYNHIRMNPLDAPKTTFMSNHDNYYFNVMLFGLKNSDATYQRLMDAFLVH